jgi:hypothetical protein
MVYVPKATKGGVPKARQTYIEVRWIVEEWWFILLWLWLGFSATVITLSVRYNVLHGWNCPRHCGAFASPFLVSLLSLFSACCVCCPILGTRGVWWCNWKRKNDNPINKVHRESKQCCCLACSWSVNVGKVTAKKGVIDTFEPQLPHNTEGAKVRWRPARTFPIHNSPQLNAG